MRCNCHAGPKTPTGRIELELYAEHLLHPFFLGLKVPGGVLSLRGNLNNRSFELLVTVSVRREGDLLFDADLPQHERAHVHVEFEIVRVGNGNDRARLYEVPGMHVERLDYAVSGRLDDHFIGRRAGSFDIGGSDVLTYKQMMEIFANLLGKRRFFIPCPFSNIRFFSYLASLFTPVPAAITGCLMEGITNEVVCQNEDIKRVLAFSPLGYREALVRAMSREEQDKVHTRWSDAYPPAHELAMKLHEIKGPVRYTSEHSLLSDKAAPSLFRSICRIGGNEGWFYSNWLWRLRGMIDRVLLGVGSSRGRRSSSTLRVGDVIDFWRVESLKQHAMLLLRAEMKLPGKAWLQFNVDPQEGKNRLSVKAYYQPAGVFGKPYWYACLPFHFLIFQNLIRQIEKRA